MRKQYAWDVKNETISNAYAWLECAYAYACMRAHTLGFPVEFCCEILKYSQVYEPYRSIVGQERGRTHRDLNERRKIKSNLNQINPNLV